MENEEPCGCEVLLRMLELVANEILDEFRRQLHLCAVHDSLCRVDDTRAQLVEESVLSIASDQLGRCTLYRMIPTLPFSGQASMLSALAWQFEAPDVRVVFKAALSETHGSYIYPVVEGLLLVIDQAVGECYDEGVEFLYEQLNDDRVVEVLIEMMEKHPNSGVRLMAAHVLLHPSVHSNTKIQAALGRARLGDDEDIREKIGLMGEPEDMSDEQYFRLIEEKVAAGDAEEQLALTLIEGGYLGD